MKNDTSYHLLALFTSIVWGTTFVSTKVLINHGLTPAGIFFYRFLLAYFLIWLFSPKKLWADTKRDELLFFCSGITGGSLYFLAENTALGITLASNVSLIICTAPLITGFLSHLLIKGERLKKRLIYGSLLALTGIAFVVFNGNFILKISPLGDILTIIAAVMWAFYNIILKQLDSRYPILFITRKVFFYGLLTMLPVFWFSPLTTDRAILFQPIVISNLVFLGVVASMLCFIFWNMAVKHLGAIRTSVYIYFIPVVTLITSAIMIDETITPIALVGAALILAGVYLAERGFPVFRKSNINRG
ncbi:drug/metabolite transporter (DMT)-like permease [Parabacteroides sp. PF5-5]|uniref:DMT family transporter n=1 Tax=unclassified Parabacteroides TaxID=2649774 RepID=UPI0024741ABE|nr:MULTISPECIES: DMT family transporter [unclassified Parabacteroides]MDH6304305.1 drug/metabolite transporter (DMT)-like permease [Parabacteroides sp. PH5-39]MDH6315542.1 drug/metabolite transporter (DMT)-like permease [Parabacteroides sp. PF5-13]MDH6318964.1 drug/metabolite transporter (DMT)-like permease [Parabacteroides sp. PH5-13]MDH6322693.1 drug/metabolite transporter (DMT)-like permease [Parabacteroides sp. PH5-8]MDH6326735.1 drug/metabolite transporter (DMT)-like permease [Parabactero